jgi:hypothetical protein
MARKKHRMISEAHVKTHTKISTTPARILQPPLAMPEHKVESPDIAVQMQSTARLGHSLRALHVDRSAASATQRQKFSDEEYDEKPLQGKFVAGSTSALQKKPGLRPNLTGLPNALKSGVENLSGFSLDNVKVHFNSDKPVKLNALAYTQGTDIYVGPGQEQHLAHEAWHVVQQAQRRVQQTMQLKGGISINDDEGLENEASVMGARATQTRRLSESATSALAEETAAVQRTSAKSEAFQVHAGAIRSSENETRLKSSSTEPVIQRLLGFEFETNFPAANLGGATDQQNIAGEIATSRRLRRYLSGQAFATTPIHNFVGQGFQAETDHAEPSRALEVARTLINLRMSMVAAPPNPRSYINPHPVPNNPKPGIVEYKTNAFDESTAAGVQALATTIQTLAAHMNAVFGQITPGIADPPLSSPNWLIGIPPLADWTTFGARYGIAPADMTNEYNRVLNSINQDIYPQVTVGILPQNIPAFFNSTQAAGMTHGQDPNLAHVTANLSQLRVSDAATVARQALADVQGQPNVLINNETVGYITLIAQYVFGSLVDSQEQFAIVKNLPLFLSKTPLTIAQQTIVAAAARPAQWPLASRQRLINKLWKYAAQRYNAQRPAARVTRHTQSSFTQADALAILATDLGPDPWSGPTAGVATLGLDPHRYNLAHPLSPGAPVANRAIILEFRALQNIHNPGALAAWANNMLALIWQLNQLTPGS